MPLAHPKPRKRSTVKRQQRQAHADAVRLVRAVVFERDHHRCRCCCSRPATSMHELVPRSRGGAVSLDNSIAVCGDGVRGCHGYLQRYEIGWDGRTDGVLRFWPTERHSPAERWLRGTLILSDPRTW